MVNMDELNTKKGLEQQDQTDEEQIISNNENRRKAWKDIGIIILITVAICMILITVMKDRDEEDLKLVLTTDLVSVNYLTEPIPTLQTKSEDINIVYTDYACAPEPDSIFDEKDTIIFKGVIKDIRNISVDFDGYKEYRTMVKIKVSKALMGNCKKGETISVLLPIVIRNDKIFNNYKIYYSMLIGMTGIFAPIEFNETDCYSVHNQTIYWKDIAKAGFTDAPVTNIFLETEEGLKYGIWNFDSDTIASSLEEVEEIIKEKIKFME